MSRLISKYCFWQRLIYGTAPSLEFLGLYHMEATRIPENLGEIVLEFPELRTVSFETDVEEKDEILPCNLLGIVNNAPALVNLVLPGHRDSMGGTATLIRQYGTKLYSLSCAYGESMRILTAEAWKTVCPNVSTLVTGNCLHWRDVELLSDRFPALRYLHLAGHDTCFLQLIEELLYDEGFVPNLVAMHVLSRRPGKLVTKNGRAQVDTEAMKRDAREEEVLLFLQKMAKSRRIFLETWSSTV